MILKMKPVFQERLWRSKKLTSPFNYPLLYDWTDECLGVSSHPNGESVIAKGKYKKYLLSDFWENK